MNRDDSPHHFLHLILQRTLIVFTLPLMLISALLIASSLLIGDATLFFAGTLSVASVLYLRHLGVKYWNFLEFDDLIDCQTYDNAPIARVREATDEEIDQLLNAMQKWDGNAATRPDSLMESNCAHRHKYKGHNSWDN